MFRKKHIPLILTMALLPASFNIKAATNSLNVDNYLTFYNEEQSFLFNLLVDSNSYSSENKKVVEGYVKPKFQQHYKYSYLLNYRIYNSYKSSNPELLDKEIKDLKQESSTYNCKKTKTNKSECLYKQLNVNIKLNMINAINNNESEELVKQTYSGDIEEKAYGYFKGIVIDNNKNSL